MRASGSVQLLLGACLVALSGTAISQDAFTVQAADVYAGPDDSYPLVAQLDPDSPLQVMGCLDDWSWCDVAFGDDHGWVYAPDVIYEYQGGFVPLYTYAPSLGIPVVQFTVVNYWDRYYRERPWYGHREEWTHRGLSHHHMPPGPRPSAGPPPLSARVERPSHESRSFREGGREHPLRLGSAGSAEPFRPRTERPPEGQPPEEQRPADRRPERAEPPPARTEQPPHEEPRREEPRREEPRREPAMPPHAEPTPHVGPPGESPPRHERHEGRSNEEQPRDRPRDEPR